MNPETHLAAARADEADALVVALRERTVLLNLEIRNRDTRIAELEQRLAEVQQADD